MTTKENEIKKQKIIDQLIWDNSVNATKVEVNVLDNTAQLKGTVPNYTAKLAAERDALMIKGIDKIENYMRVEFPPAITIPDDSQVTENIKERLKNDSQVNIEKINIDTVNGVVRLTGMVYTYWEKNLIEGIISSMRGVAGIENNLSVNLTESIKDLEIEGEIYNALDRSILVDESNVEVKVIKGIAHLKGNVANNLIKIEAERIASFTKGVKDVENEITIG